MKATTFVLVLIVAFAAVTPAYADAGEIKRACTVSDNWLTKLFDPCVELSSQPSVITFDPTKWEQALNDAEQALRDASNGNNDPVDSDNIAWKLYCGIEGQPVFDAEGHPICNH